MKKEFRSLPTTITDPIPPKINYLLRKAKDNSGGIGSTI